MKKNKEPEENLFEALALIEKEKGIPADFMLAQISKAIVTACKNSYGGNDDVSVVYNEARGRLEATLNKVVVEEVTDINREISLPEAKKLKAGVQIGDKVGRDGEGELAGEELDAVAGHGIGQVHRQGHGAFVLLHQRQQLDTEIGRQHRGRDLDGKTGEERVGHVAQQHYLLGFEGIWHRLAGLPLFGTDEEPFGYFPFDIYGTVQLEVAHKLLVLFGEEGQFV